MPTVGKAYVQIIPKTDGNLSKEVEASLGGDAIGRNTGTKIAGGISSALKIGGAAAGVLAGATAAITGSIVNNTQEVAAYGDNIDKMSQKMGMSAQAYQEWDAIMQHSGTSIDAMKAPMKTLANAAQTGSDAFQKLGISEEEVKNLSQEDLFGKVITGLQGMEEGTERTAIASDLLGRGATELGALLNTSAEDTEAMRQAVHDLGGVMDDEAVKASAAFQDQLQDMQTALEGTKRNMMAEFLPSLTTVMSGLTTLFSGGDGMGQITQGINEFANQLLQAVPKILEVGTGIVGALSDAIIQNLPLLIDAATQTIITLLQGIISRLPDILVAGVQILVTFIQGISQALPQLIPAMYEAIGQMVATLAENADLLVGAALTLMIALASGLVKAIPVIVKNIPTIIKAIVSGLGKAGKEMISVGKDLVSGIWNGIKDKTEWLKNQIKGFVGNVTSFLKRVFKIGSPSKLWADEIGHWLAPGIGEGLLSNTDGLYKDIDNVSAEATRRLQIGASVNANSARNGRSIYGANSGTSLSLSGIREDINRLGDKMAQMQIVMSNGALVGAISADMDNALGAKQAFRQRGVVA